MVILTLKCWHFEASKYIMTKFKSQGLHIIRIKLWNASSSCFPTSVNPTLWNIGILYYWQAKLRKHLQYAVLPIYQNNIWAIRLCDDHTITPFPTVLYWRLSDFWRLIRVWRKRYARNTFIHFQCNRPKLLLCKLSYFKAIVPSF